MEIMAVNLLKSYRMTVVLSSKQGEEIILCEGLSKAGILADELDPALEERRPPHPDQRKHLLAPRPRDRGGRLPGDHGVGDGEVKRTDVYVVWLYQGICGSIPDYFPPDKNCQHAQDRA